MKKTLAFILAAGCVAGSYATDARVEVMGKHDAFFRDEVSIFRNPADMSLYPNMMYGSYGWVDKTLNLNKSTYMRDNLTLSDPFFGAMISHKFSEAENAPMFSLGTFVNRRDRILDYLMEAGGGNLKEPVGKLDLMFGYDMGNGIALGLGLYGAYQKEKTNDVITAQTGVYKLTAGINWNLDQGLDFEASFNGGSIRGTYTPRTSNQLVKITDGDYFYRGDVRFFSAVPSINGAFVPQVSMEIMKLNKVDIIDVAGGIGLNMNIDRGFFWAGLQGLYTQRDMDKETEESIGGRLSFGIERNIVWDWFLIRVGGEKELRYESKNSGKNSKWVEKNNDLDTPYSEDALVGLGFGVNIDNRLRIDFVSSNDVAYTFTNLISGPQLSLFKRISATYRF
jgi:hypothetical protein